MGNASSHQRSWDWEFKNGRANIKLGKPKPRGKPKPKLKFKTPPKNNYDWWIFNPDTPKNRSNSKKR